MGFQTKRTKPAPAPRRLARNSGRLFPEKRGEGTIQPGGAKPIRLRGRVPPNASKARKNRAQTQGPALVEKIGDAVSVSRRLLLPRAFLVAIGAELLAPFMLVDLRFASFLQ